MTGPEYDPADPLDIDPQTYAELEFASKEIEDPTINRNYNFEGVIVVKPDHTTRLPGETAVEAHIRLQAERNDSK